MDPYGFNPTHQNKVIFIAVHVDPMVLETTMEFLWWIQWEFQDPKLEVPTIYKTYFSGLNFREYPNKIWSEICY
jgi:hypothetical protein